mmetsp:Transcript_28014/g.41682  ORF Transcript_28014/g.41682 Transcript_28014/m.41682 type:complete len:504 (-) Transcript_28014:172-1683(-)
MTSNQSTPQHIKIAIVGGGITGSCAAHELFHISQQSENVSVEVHLFDQGRRGVGGRSSHRIRHNQSNPNPEVNGDLNNEKNSQKALLPSERARIMRWDHGCQFFRADTERFQTFLQEYIKKGIVQEWKGDFRSISSNENETVGSDFFGMPSLPPFYVGSGENGMQSVTKGILDSLMNSQKIQGQDEEHKLKVFNGTRVARLQLDGKETSQKWKLLGTSGEAAFHDTPEQIVQQINQKIILGDPQGYDGIILTDVSSSFGTWHRASAGVPESFASRVRERVGARVPLFTVMIAFETKSAIPFDAAAFDHDVLWFASKSNSKPGMDGRGDDMMECWTLVSTPKYAMDKIEETPMQDPKTGEFIPQTDDYLQCVPGPDLKAVFLEEITSRDGILSHDALVAVPSVVYTDAQRWGSALPAHRHLDENSITRKTISGVPYDSCRCSLAPTKKEQCRHGDERTFLVDEELNLVQAGDMMSSFTPGFEGAALSGMDAAKYLFEKLSSVRS